MSKVYGLHMVELYPGVTDDQFEIFVLTKFLPGLGGLGVPGVEFHLLKADRGEREGKFLFMMVFDSLETRDRYFPGHNQPSAELLAIIKPLQALSQIWDRLSEREKTDYVLLEEQVEMNSG
jgi:hypothetical protein